MNALGIDVGLRTSGYVVCNVSGSRISLMREGQIKPHPKKPLPDKLFEIYETLSSVMSAYKPQAVIVEKLYSHYRHPTTIAALAQVRGVVLLCAKMQNVRVHEYAPTRARKSFLGRGHVSAKQVKKMAENIVGSSMLSEHTADAFSLVVAFSHTLKVNRLTNDWKTKRTGSSKNRRKTLH